MALIAASHRTPYDGLFIKYLYLRLALALAKLSTELLYLLGFRMFYLLVSFLLELEVEFVVRVEIYLVSSVSLDMMVSMKDFSLVMSLLIFRYQQLCG